MDKFIARMISVMISLASTPTVAQELGDSLGELIGELRDIDMHVADTGFEADKDKYTFGAKRELAKDATIGLGIGGRIKNVPEYGLSNGYRAEQSQTNMIEENYDPAKASPMIGMNFMYKF